MSANISVCDCGSFLPQNMCCEQYLSGKSTPATAEALMRSRYTAFTVGNVDYLYETYADDWKKKHSKVQFLQDFTQMDWEGLEVLAIFQGSGKFDTGEVEFVAHYRYNGLSFSVHERSFFQKEDGQWRYVGEVISKS